MRHAFRYFDSDAWYDALVDRLVTPDCCWIDVGGGTSVFPGNMRLAERLSRRCALLVGVDPSDNIDQNQIVHERVKSTIEAYRSELRFDLATLRMVAEHVQDPHSLVTSLGRLVKRGGKVVIYTPNRWSPVSIAAALLPFCLHHRITNFLWQTKEEDVFPTVYRMNGRIRLRTLFQSGGFSEVAFAYLDNCTTFQRFRMSCFLELSFWRVLRVFGVLYPENNLLGVYEKQ
jgi:SAM-dependent methyltransferase